MKTKNSIHKALFASMILGFSACASIPKGAEAVEGFENEKYLGKWYEIARMDFRFEKNLNNTTAEYTVKENGMIKVDNQGYNTVKNEWTQAIGKAKFVGPDHVAMLKVSFFGPFYSGYNVLAIDKDYQYALVAGRNLDFLWILSRKTSIPTEIKSQYLALAEKIGFQTSDLIWVEHDKSK